jgi:hypothetical protein
LRSGRVTLVRGPPGRPRSATPPPIAPQRFRRLLALACFDAMSCTRPQPPARRGHPPGAPEYLVSLGARLSARRGRPQTLARSSPPRRMPSLPLARAGQANKRHVQHSRVAAGQLFVRRRRNYSLRTDLGAVWASCATAASASFSSRASAAQGGRRSRGSRMEDLAGAAVAEGRGCKRHCPTRPIRA